MENNTSAIYCVDTSSFIHSWSRDYPPDVFPGVWKTLEKMIEQNILISPEEVLFELERGDDQLVTWARENRHMFIQPDGPTQRIVNQIVNQNPNFVPKHSTDGIWADPYVIALASTKNAIVITGEVPVGPNAKKLKIPNICSNLSIKYTNMLGMLRDSNLQF